MESLGIRDNESQLYLICMSILFLLSKFLLSTQYGGGGRGEGAFFKGFHTKKEDK